MKKNHVFTIFLIAITSFVILCVSSYLSASSYYDGHAVTSSAAIDECAAKLLIGYAQTIVSLPAGPKEFEAYLGVWKICAEKVRLGDQLQRARIVDMAYLDQFFAGRISLYVVVVITLSGVALAGFQLWSAFRFSPMGSSGARDVAETGMSLDSSLSLEMGKISIKSSISGVVILVISFAFFFVYIEKVYTITSHQDRTRPVVTGASLPVLDAKGVTGDR